MLLRFEPFEDLGRWFGGSGRVRNRSVPMDAYRRGDAFFVHFDKSKNELFIASVTDEDPTAITSHSLGPVPTLPIIDLNSPRTRRALTAFGVLALIGSIVLAVGTYKGVEYMESVEFCGTTCHTVMQPEYTAYQGSPHARVACVSCHIGPGAEWFVRAKISGAYQVYSVTFNKFSRPISTPIENLRPAQDVCEQCHWPAKFWGEQLAERVHFSSDEKNTRRQVSLLIKTGGGSVAGVNAGIHYHMNIQNKIWYAAADERRQVIPWIRVEGPDGKAVSDPGFVLGVRISDGRLLWKQPVNDPESSPAIDESGMVFSGSPYFRELQDPTLRCPGCFISGSGQNYLPPEPVNRRGQPTQPLIRPDAISAPVPLHRSGLPGDHASFPSIDVPTLWPSL